MPVAPTYPGVYIEELSSGVRTISGVATSITAFVGRARRGPTDQSSECPVMVRSFGDYERIFGGLWEESAMSYAVYDFFQNGGGQALIVRLFKANGGQGEAPVIDANGLKLVPANPGSWARGLRARIDHDVAGELEENAFNLTIYDGSTGDTEVFRNLSHEPNLGNSVDKVLDLRSSLVRVPEDGLPEELPEAHEDPEKQSLFWTDDDASSGFEEADQEKIDDGDAPGAGEFVTGRMGKKQGIYALLKADLFNLLCLPVLKGEDAPQGVVEAAANLCEQRRAFLILDAPKGWASVDKAAEGGADFANSLKTDSRNAAVFFPRFLRPNPKRGGQEEEFAACGAVAGVFARTDAQRGVWKAPAGLEADLRGAGKLGVPLTDDENGQLNPLAINCLRVIPGAGPVVWGARTLRGADRRADTDNKYIPVRRLMLYLEESLYRGTTWAVFEPNDEPLWAQLRLNIGAFLSTLFRQGAFAGQSARDAYFVKCDRTTTTQTDVNLGIVNIVVGFAPLKPAEFVIIKFQQMAGQIPT